MDKYTKRQKIFQNELIRLMHNAEIEFKKINFDGRHVEVIIKEIVDGMKKLILTLILS